MRMKKIFVLFSLFLAAAPWARSQDGSSVAMPFLAIDRSGVTSAMGGARITDPMYNPAAIPFSGSNAQLSYQLWSPGVAKANHINALSGVKLGSRLGLSVHGAFQSGQAYTLYDGVGKAGSSFTPTDLLIGLGAGFSFTSFLSAGVNLNFASQKLAPGTSYNAFAADIFLLFKKDGLKASAGVANIGSKVNGYSIPSSARLGASYCLPFGLGFAADFDYYFAGGLAIGAGAQYGWNDMVFVRAGYHFENGKSPLPSYASLGLGAKFYGVHLDVSYLLASEALANTLTVGLGYAF